MYRNINLLPPRLAFEPHTARFTAPAASKRADIMYITPDMFSSQSLRRSAPASAFPLPNHNHRTIMVDATGQASLGKRKRTQDLNDGISTSNHHDSSVHSPQLSPSSKTCRRPQSSPHISSETTHIPLAASIINPTVGRPTKQYKRTCPNNKPLTTLRKLPSHLMDTDCNITPATPPPIAAADLRACHICHSAPKRKSDLENYLECQVCAERACYICARECYGGCKKQVCSKCCVQVGEDWDTYCLSCYQRNIGEG